jgi:hypothetical protein
MPPTRRALLASVAALASTGGCLAGGDESSTTTESTRDPPSPASTTETPAAETDRSTEGRTPFQGTPVDFPDGPKAQPPIPDRLSRESVREFVHTHEYRFAYNQLWYGSGTDVTLSCEVGTVEDVGVGYRAVVTCRGSSTVRGTVENSTKTRTPIHADWFDQTYVYLVDEETVIRRYEDG